MVGIQTYKKICNPILVPLFLEREGETSTPIRKLLSIPLFRRTVEFSKQRRRAWSIEFHATTIPFLPLPVAFISPNDLHTGRKKKKKRSASLKRKGGGEREGNIGNIGVFPGIKIRKRCTVWTGAGFNETISRVLPTSMQYCAITDVLKSW